MEQMVPKMRRHYAAICTGMKRMGGVHAESYASTKNERGTCWHICSNKKKMKPCIYATPRATTPQLEHKLHKKFKL